MDNYSFFDNWFPVILWILNNFNQEDVETYDKRVDIAFTHAVKHNFLRIAQKLLDTFEERPKLYQFSFLDVALIRVPERQVKFLLNNGYDLEEIRIFKSEDIEVSLVNECLFWAAKFMQNRFATIEEIIDQDAYTRVIYYLVSEKFLDPFEPRADLQNMSPYEFIKNSNPNLALVKYFEGIKEETNPNKKFKSKERFSLETSGILSNSTSLL